jgi:hypothetical protein
MSVIRVLLRCEHGPSRPNGDPETRCNCAQSFLSVDEVEVCIYLTASSVLSHVKLYTYT